VLGKKLLAVHTAVLAGIATLVAVAYGLAAVLMTVDIGIRALNVGALPWLLELTEYLLYAGTFLAAPWVLRQGAHVRVDVLAAGAPAPWSTRMEIATDVVGAMVSGVLICFGSVAVAEAWRDNTMQFKTWAVPEWILLAPIPVAATLLMIEFVLRAARVPGVVQPDADRTQRASI
jgi:TRAP-type C4-dicarboxylate transport system permease small subunit